MYCLQEALKLRVPWYLGFGVMIHVIFARGPWVSGGRLQPHHQMLSICQKWGQSSSILNPKLKLKPRLQGLGLRVLGP